MGHRRFLSFLALLLCAWSAPLAWAFAPNEGSAPLSALVRMAPAPQPQPNPAEGARLRAAHSAAVAALEREAGGRWVAEFDPENGLLRRAFGAGIPLLPSWSVEPGVAEMVGRGFVAAHAELFNIEPGELSFRAAGSQPLRDGRVQPIQFVRAVGGVEVQYSQLQLVVNHGNLVYLNMTGFGPLSIDPVPTLDSGQTWAAVAAAAARVGASVAGSVEVGKAGLLIMPLQAAPGAPIEHRLVRQHTFRLAEGLETWQASVDAHSGELVQFEDLNKYACSLDPTKLQGQVRGGVRPAQATDPEQVWNLPYVALDDDGAADETDFTGYYFYSGNAASSRLQGKYFAVNCNGCNPNPPLASTSTDGIIDFGTGGVNQTSNGRSTPADRTAFYHLTVARAIGAKWRSLPWLDVSVGCNVNIAQTCNAFWNGTSVNFFRSGGGCNNTGEIRDVMQHEWGHGLDGNDGQAPRDSAMGEAYGDHIALFVDHDSCIGQSFFGNSSGPYCTTNPDCLSTLTCTGVRNIDEKRTTRGLITTGNVTTKCGPSSCAGPMGRECHCEGEIYGQAAFHLAYNFMTGNEYDTGAALPAGNPAMSPVAAWFIHERLFFNANGIMVSYAPSNLQTRGTSSYDAYMAVDDDNGNLADGTPNAAYINQAFQHHGMAEQTLIADSANCTPPGDPTITLQPLLDSTTGFAQVRVSWPDQNASFYLIYRAMNPGDVWLPVRGQVVDDNRPTYDIYDEPIQVGVTYYYAVVAVAANGCPSPGADVKNVVVALPDAAASVNRTSDAAPGGDGDGIPEPGEAIQLWIDLRETANLVGLQNASITLSTSDPLASVTVPGPVAYGNVAPGQTVAGTQPFTVAISASHGCGTRVPLTAAIEADNGCFLRALALDIPTPGCVPGGRGEAAPSSLVLASDNGDPACTDFDGIPDNGEQVNLSVDVTNQGTATAANVRVTFSSPSPLVTVLSANPVTIPSLNAGQTQPVSFTFRVDGATCQQDIRLDATATSDQNFFPITRSLNVTAEMDIAAAQLDTGFETDFGGWTQTSFTRSTARKNSGTWSAFAGPRPEGHACDNSGDGGDDCAKLVSPLVLVGPAGRLTLSNWYSFEAFDGTQYWDRANVHIVEGANHTVIRPAAGTHNYVGASAGSQFCHIGAEDGWAGNTAGTNWGNAVFDLSSYAGRWIQIELNYNSDGLAICEGIYIDDVTTSDLQVKTCDALNCNVSAPNVVVDVCAGADLCAGSGTTDGVADPGEDVTYDITLHNTGAGAATDVRGDVVVNGGGTLVSGGTIGGTPQVDIPAGSTYVHRAVVRVTGNCGQPLDVDVTNLRAGSTPFSANTTICDRAIGFSQPAQVYVLRDTANLAIPDDTEYGVDRSLIDNVPATVNSAMLRIVAPHPRPSDLQARLVGPRGSQVVATAALTAPMDVTALVNFDGAGVYRLILEDRVRIKTGTLVEWTLTLDAPAIALCNPCTGGCAAPSYTVGASSPTVCPDETLVFTATIGGAGQGSFDYEWDFGDGGLQTVTDPAVPVSHRFDGALPSYTVTLRATSRSSATCDATASTVVTRATDTPPSGGPIGNRLRGVHQGSGAAWSWTGSGISPANFRMFKTSDRRELADNATGIGDEPVVGRTSLEALADPGAFSVAPALAFYEVYAESSCGQTVFP